jgi:hypothetical protein
MFAKMTTTPVCEHCRGKPAHGDTSYCEDCAAKLKKELGLVDEEDEEKNADGAGGSAEPSAAPGVSVEPTPAAGQQTAEPCIGCQKPATRGSRCEACNAAELAKIKEKAEVERKLEAVAVEAYRAEIEQCKACKPISQVGSHYAFCCRMHLNKIDFFVAGVNHMVAGAEVGGASGTLAPEVLLEQMTLNAPAVVASDLARHIKKCAQCAKAGEKQYCDKHRDMVDACLKVRIAMIGAAFGGQVFKPSATPAAAVESPSADGNGAAGAGGATPPAAPEVSVERSPEAPDGSVEQGAAAASQTAQGCVECNEPATNGRLCAACVAKAFAEHESRKEAERKVNQLKREAADATIAAYERETKRCAQCRSRIRLGLYCEDCNGRL